MPSASHRVGVYPKPLRVPRVRVRRHCVFALTATITILLSYLYLPVTVGGR